MAACIVESLPVDLLQNVMVTWLDLVDVAHVDSAMCNQRRRRAFLSTVFGETCTYDYSNYFSKEACKKAYLFCHHQFLIWISIRGVRLSSLNIDQTTGMYYVDPLLATAIVRHTGRHIRTLTVDAYCKDLHAVIAECCPALESIRFKARKMDHTDLLPILRRCQRLRHLAINSDSDSQTIAAISHVGTHIESLSVRFARGAVIDWPLLLSSLPKLTALDLTKSNVSDADVMSIAQQHGSLLRSLVLDDILLSEDALLAVAEQCPQLQRIGLPVNCEPDTMLTVLTRCRSLTAVQLSFGAVTAEVLNALARDFQGLRELQLKYSANGDVAALAGLVHNWPLLERLWLGNVVVKDVLLQELGCCCPCLRSFIARKGQFDAGGTDVGVTALAKGCPQLRQVIIMSKSLTNEAIDAIVAHCRYIQLVELHPYRRKLEMRPLHRKFLLA
jgi:hypothetical protein